MGFITNITISNDFFHELKKNPDKFITAIGSGMNSGTKDIGHEAFQIKHYGNVRNRDFDDPDRFARTHGVKVHSAQHADTGQVVISLPSKGTYTVTELENALRHDHPDAERWVVDAALDAADTLEGEAQALRDAVKRYDKRCRGIYRCSKCGAPKGAHVLGESCNNNCGGKVIRVGS